MNLKEMRSQVLSNKFEIFTTLLVIYSFVLYPTWLLGPTGVIAGLRVAIVVGFSIVWLFVTTWLKKHQFDKSITSQLTVKDTGIELNKILFLFFLTSIFYFKDFFNITFASGGDEASHVSATLNLYFILFLKTRNIAISIVIFGILLFFTILIILCLNMVIERIILLSRTKLYTSLSIFLILSSFLIGYLGFELLTRMNLIIHPYLPSILMRFPPAKQFLGTVIIALFGPSDSLIRLSTILLMPISIYTAYTIILDLSLNVRLIDNPTFQYFILLTLSILFVFDPILYVFSIMYFQSTGELLFVLITIKYTLRYLRSYHIRELQVVVFSLAFGFLFRRTILFLTISTISFIGLVIIFNFFSSQEYKNSNLRSFIRSNQYPIWILTFPFYIILYWMISVITAPYEDAFLVPKSNISRLSLNPSSHFSIYDYPIMILEIYGPIIGGIFLVSLIFLLLMSNVKDTQIVYILYSTLIWIVGVSIEGYWPSRVDRFIQIIPPIFHIIWITAVLIIFSTDGLIGLRVSYTSSKILASIFILSVLLFSQIATTQYREDNYQRFIENNTYPFEDLAEYLQDNYINKHIYIPWNGVNPMGFYAFQYQLSQSFYNTPWSDGENQTLSEFYQYVLDSNYDIVVLPETNSTFILKNNLVSENVSIPMHQDNPYFEMINTFEYKGNFLYLWIIIM